jgi:ribosomal protein S18 acetylase RimI-like enzyme
MASIRRAALSDAAALAVLAERTFRDAFADSNDPVDMELHCQERFGEDVQTLEITDPLWITLLAEAEDELVGFAQVRRNAPIDCVAARRPTELHRIYVARTWHGRGVAQELMNEVMAVAEADGSDRIWLGVWEENRRALAFYRKYGFEVVGAQEFMFGTERQQDLVMVTNVQSAPDGDRSFF